MNYYNVRSFRQEAAPLLCAIGQLDHVEAARQRLFDRVTSLQFQVFSDTGHSPEQCVYVHDCVRTLRGMLEARSDKLGGFSIAQALFDIAQHRPRPELTPAFFAEMIHIVRGILGTARTHRIGSDLCSGLHLYGRQAALQRSDDLDTLASRASDYMHRYPCGLDDNIAVARRKRQAHIIGAMGASLRDWNNPWWHMAHVLRNVRELQAVVTLTDEEAQAIELARKHRIAFGITPFYASLMDDEPYVNDRAIRAQVFPSLHYVQQMHTACLAPGESLDFMRERDTSPINLITRRYPGIVILKPFNTCPQICVYCQRNWEITDAMMQNAMADENTLNAAIEWIAEHPAISDVLITGGDPLAMTDKQLLDLLGKLARIESVTRIRIGTRIPVTLPMRITADLLDHIASFKQPARREICFVTHVQHPYELNPNLIDAVQLIRHRGMTIYNQNVYTFFISRRFEATLLRRKLRLIGIEPYYTFNTKGKDETVDYRVPIARLLQEQHEEARLMPGMERSDEAVFNVPGLGKNYLRAKQHRDLITVMPNGARVYQWHPWEKNISEQSPYLLSDVPILDYLQRLQKIGEDISHYDTIWYYY